MRRSLVLAAVLLGVGAPARAYMCPPDYRPYVDLAWLDESAGFVAVGEAAVMLAMDGDCKHRYAVPAADLRVSVAHSADGPFEPIAIEQRGKVFAWRPRADGVWFVRVERKPAARVTAPAPAGAVVVAYERAARMKAMMILPSLQGGLVGRVALTPIVETDGDWLLPHVLLPAAGPDDAIAVRLPRGRYLARDAIVDRSRTDDGVRRIHLLALTSGQSGTLDVVADGDVHLAMHKVCRMPMPRR
jgi:hypothetical protein